MVCLQRDCRTKKAAVRSFQDVESLNTRLEAWRYIGPVSRRDQWGVMSGEWRVASGEWRLMRNAAYGLSAQ